MNVGKNIKKYRNMKGMTQTQLAEKVLVRQQMILAYERGTKNPSLQVAYEISKALGCTLEDLIGDGEE